MKLFKFFPLIFLLIYLLLIFKPFFFEGKLPIPADTIVGMYHPWRDYFVASFPNGIPFKNFQITDSVRQQYPWRNLSIEILKKGELPLWNPYNLAGTPLLANLQSAPFYPLNALFFIFDFSLAWSILVILQIILGGIFMHLFLKNLSLSPMAVTIGVLSWVGSGFFVAWLEWNTTVQTAIWLPLLLLSTDKIFFSRKKIFWSGVWTFSLGSSFLAGYLQPFFYIVLLTLFYFLARLMQTRNWKVIIYFVFSFILFMFLTKPQWQLTLEFIHLSAREVDQANWQRQDWFLPRQNLTQLIAPDFFGNPATLNYFGVWNYQEFVGYIGIVGLFFALFGILFRRDKKTIFFLTSLIIFLIFVLPTILGKLPFQIGIPFLSTAQPSRIILIIVFGLAVLASFGLDSFLKTKNLKTFYLPVIFIFCLGALWIIAFVGGLTISQRNLLLPTVLVTVTILLFWLSARWEKQKTIFVLFLLFLVVFDLSRFAAKFESFSDKKWLYPPTRITNFLQEKTREDIFRVAVIDDRIMPPNFNIPYKLQTISGYDPLYLKRYGELITAIERGKADNSLPWGFNRIITPKNFESRFFDLLGIKYLLSLNEIKSPKYFLVWEEGQSKVYENKQVLPRAFFINKIIAVNNKQTALEEMFSPSFDFRKMAVLEENINQENFTGGKVNIVKYSENEVILRTVNQGTGFLVLIDVYYPGWQATIDGIKTKIYLTDYVFRGVIIPSGNHELQFIYQ
ncbi:YfhO family protein [Candidatus Gottesmanbacteria bacterium]|nr:YfhO family protein [Candidatus Gottesmanbacteria bacterium]